MHGLDLRAFPMAAAGSRPAGDQPMGAMAPLIGKVSKIHVRGSQMLKKDNLE